MRLFLFRLFVVISADKVHKDSTIDIKMHEL